MVDDEPSVRKLASAILGRHGYRTVTAAEGREGTQAVLNSTGKTSGWWSAT